eukprot:940794-Pyramimonas_sp.AAC.1
MNNVSASALIADRVQVSSSATHDCLVILLLNSSVAPVQLDLSQENHHHIEKIAEYGRLFSPSADSKLISGV